MDYRANAELVSYRCNDSAHLRLPSKTPSAGDDSFSDLLNDLGYPIKKDKKKTGTSINTLQSQQYYINARDSEQNIPSSSENPELREVQSQHSRIVQYDELSTNGGVVILQMLLQMSPPLDIISFNFPLKIEFLSDALDAKAGQAIIDAIHHAYHNKIHKVSIAINPPQFGNLDVELIFAGDQVKNVNITATTEEAMRALTSSISMSALSNALAENSEVQEQAIELHLNLQHGGSSAHHDDQQLSRGEAEVTTNTGRRVPPALLQASSGVDIIV